MKRKLPIWGWPLFVLACSGEVSDDDPSDIALEPGNGLEDDQEQSGTGDEESTTPAARPNRPAASSDSDAADPESSPDNPSPANDDTQPGEATPSDGPVIEPAGNAPDSMVEEEPSGEGGTGADIAEPGPSPTAQGGSATEAPGPVAPGGGGAPAAPVDGVDMGSAGAPAEEQPLYRVLFDGLCAECHGAEGEGVAGKGPELRHPHAEHFTWVVRNGDLELPSFYDEEMVAWAAETLTDETVDDMIAWLNAFEKPTAPDALYADYCGNCHGADGRGGPDAYASAYHSAPFTRRRGDAFIDYVRQGHVVNDAGDPVPISDRHAYMPPVTSAELSDDELRAIEAWLPQ